MVTCSVELVTPRGLCFVCFVNYSKIRASSIDKAHCKWSRAAQRLVAPRGSRIAKRVNGVTCGSKSNGGQFALRYLSL